MSRLGFLQKDNLHKTERSASAQSGSRIVLKRHEFLLSACPTHNLFHVEHRSFCKAFGMVLIDLGYDDFAAMVRAREGRNVPDSELQRRFAKLDLEAERANQQAQGMSHPAISHGGRPRRLNASRSAPGLRLHSLASSEDGFVPSASLSRPMRGGLDDGVSSSLPVTPATFASSDLSSPTRSPTRAQQRASAERMSSAPTGSPEHEVAMWPSFDPPGFAAEASFEQLTGSHNQGLRSRPGSRACSRPSSMQSRQRRLLGEIAAQEKDVYGGYDPRQLLADGRYDGFMNVVVDDSIKPQRKLLPTTAVFAKGLLPGGLPAHPVGGHKTSASTMPEPSTVLPSERKDWPRPGRHLNSHYYRSRTPRFTPTRTYSGQDTRNFVADDPFDKFAHKYQARTNYWVGFPEPPPTGEEDEDERLGTQPRETFHAVADSFRIGTIVRHPHKQHASFVSEAPRFTPPRQLEPFYRREGARRRQEHFQSASARKAFWVTNR